MEYEEVASTNSLAEKLPLSELKDKQVILTWRQTQGRGQATNRWESAPGKNISMTVIFRPECLEAGKQFAVSMVIALGCLDFLSHYVEGVTVKWPNDPLERGRFVYGTDGLRRKRFDRECRTGSEQLFGRDGGCRLQGVGGNRRQRIPQPEDGFPKGRFGCRQAVGQLPCQRIRAYFGLQGHQSK
jgi:hypothetical protein